MVTVNQATVGAVLQACWKEDAQEFADCVASRCEDRPPHSGRSVLHDLDDCTADSDGPTNYYYGQLGLISEIAGKLGITLDKAVPKALPLERRGR